MTDAALAPASDPIAAAVAAVPAGRWAVGVSGGADSVALLSLLAGPHRARGDLHAHAVHLDHQTRGHASDADAAFVRNLCRAWDVPCSVDRLGAVASRRLSGGGGGGGGGLPANASSRFRALRLALFAEVARAHDLDGVLLAHHADDQAETILHRLLRGSGYAGLTGMDRRTTLAGVCVLRPLLSVRGASLRARLRRIGQPWREDASNATDAYLRNRLRRALAGRDDLTAALLALGDACRGLRDWAAAAAPSLGESFPVGALADLPTVLARTSAGRWLAARGAPPGDLPPAVLDRLTELAADAAAPPRQHFPGRLPVRRRRGVISLG